MSKKEYLSLSKIFQYVDNSQGIIILNDNAKIRYVNEDYVKNHGFISPRELIGKEIEQLYLGYDIKRFNNPAFRRKSLPFKIII